MGVLRLCHDKEEWDDYVLDSGGHPLQLWGWGDVKAQHGWEAERLFFYSEAEEHQDEEIIGAAQVLVRYLPWPFKSLAYVPRGPIVDEFNKSEMLDALAEYVKRVHNSVVLSIEPDSVEFNVPQGWKKSKNKILPAQTIILDFKKSENELLGDMAKKTRQYIRKSGSEPVKIERIRSREDLDKCLAIYHETAKRAKFNVHDDQYYYDVFSKLASHSQVFAAYHEDKPIAFLWLAVSAETAFELYGGVNDIGQSLRANYTLKWQAIQKCKSWGIKRYDFGGLIDGGVSTFKKGWASEETVLAGTFDRPLSKTYGLWSGVLPTAKLTMQRIKAAFKR